MVDRAKMDSEEKMTVEAMGNWYKWLKSKGCELRIVSDTNPAPKYVPRVNYKFTNL